MWMLFRISQIQSSNVGRLIGCAAIAKRGADPRQKPQFRPTNRLATFFQAETNTFAHRF
jgi:hypothetical protein